MASKEQIAALGNEVSAWLHETTGFRPSDQISNEFAMKVYAEAHQNNALQHFTAVSGGA